MGGSVSDEAVAYSIVIDPDENIYVTGKAGLNFQTTNDAYDTSFNDEGDAFVSKLNGNLTDLLASTYLGGLTRIVAILLSQIQVEMFM